MAMNRFANLAAAYAVCTFLTACGGGGDSAPTDPLAYPVTGRSTADVENDPRTPARIAFDHLSFAARASALPWGWLSLSTTPYACSSAGETMAVTHPDTSGSTVSTISAFYTPGDVVMLNSTGCTFSLFQNYEGYWRGDVQSGPGWTVGGNFDAVMLGSVGISFDVVRGTISRRSLVLGPYAYTVHKDASGMTVDTASIANSNVTQDQTALAPYPQLQISALALHLAAGPTGDLLDSVSGHFTFSGYSFLDSTNGVVTINTPIKFSSNGDGAVAGKMTVVLTNGRITVMEFSGTGQGKVRVTSAPNTSSAAVEVYNGSVAGLLSNF